MSTLRTITNVRTGQRALAVWLPFLLLAATSARANERPDAKIVRLQAIVDALRSELAIPEEVTLELVPENPRMASVEPSKKGDGFVLAIEDAFVDRLTESELKSVIAHELGHVWIFTHHPYLQTEQLANRIAMRVVSRESLEHVYGKVWKEGAKGDLGRFLGVAPATTTAPAATAASLSPNVPPKDATVPAKDKLAEGGAIRD
jgi:hypothetical protein